MKCSLTADGIKIRLAGIKKDRPDRPDRPGAAQRPRLAAWGLRLFPSRFPKPESLFFLYLSHLKLNILFTDHRPPISAHIFPSEFLPEVVENWLFARIEDYRQSSETR
jgi:hypothetical protein